MRFEKPEYEYPIYELDRRETPGRAAGIYYLGGRCTIAAYGGRTEQALVELGAILVATLRFGPGPFERSHAGRLLQSLTAAAARELTASAVN